MVEAQPSLFTVPEESEHALSPLSLEPDHPLTSLPEESTHTLSALPAVGTGTPRLTASRSLKYYVNGELEVARSLGDFQLKQGRIRERHWNFPSEERELEGVSGFHGDVVSDVPFVK